MGSLTLFFFREHPLLALHPHPAHSYLCSRSFQCHLGGAFPASGGVRAVQVLSQSAIAAR